MMSKISDFILTTLHNTKLRYKLLISHFIIIVVLLLSFSLISYNIFHGIIQNHVMYSARQNYDQTLSFLTYKLEIYEKISNVISYGSNINGFPYQDMQSTDAGAMIKKYRDLVSLLLSAEDNVDVVKVRLYIDGEIPYSGENVNIFSLDSIDNEEWYKILMSSDRKILYCPQLYISSDNEKELLSVARKIVDLNNFNRIIGFSRVDIYEENINAIIRKANTTDNSLTYLCNSDNIIVSSSNKELYEKYAVDINIVEKLSGIKDTLSEIELGTEKVLVQSNLLPGTDWYVVTVTPLSEILSKVDIIRRQMVLLVIIMGMIAYILTYYISTSITRRITLLNEKMRDVQKGDFNSISGLSGKDEISDLTNNFNFMLEKISLLIEEQYKAGFDIKNAELKALQAQINPHFLYNTLEMINWLAKKGRTSDVEAAVFSLAAFYKLSLNKGRDITTIRDELSHVTAYLKIQNIRFKDNIILSEDIEASILDYSIPNATLQPIVENSIIHGILPKGQQKGTISITGSFRDSDIVISVKDDGIGMSQDSLNKLTMGDVPETSGSGYGISNIAERLRLIYGEKYGITYISTPGKGTKAEILIPAVRIAE